MRVEQIDIAKGVLGACSVASKDDRNNKGSSTSAGTRSLDPERWQGSNEPALRDSTTLVS